MARIVKPLTDREIKTAEVKDKEYKLSDGKGLYLVVRKSGTKYFRFDFSYGGKRNSTSFGTYPEISLKEAREKREEARELLSRNISPITDKKLKKETESLRFLTVVDEWLELRAKSASSATVTQNRRMLNNFTNWLGNIPIKDIKRIDIIDILEKVQNRGTFETAHRLYSLINKIYMYSVTKDYIEHNIIADIDKKTLLVPNDKNQHHPAITEPKEIKQLLIDINQMGEKFRNDISVVAILRIAPYVFVRSENLRLMRWDELDLEQGIWEIPQSKMKTNIDFVFPLPTQAIEMIKQIEPYSRHRSEFVFPSRQKKDTGIAGGTLSINLAKIGYQDKHTFHGFRSMFSTNAYEYQKEHGFNSDIIEACLSHKEKNRIKAAYNRESKYKYINEKKELIQWWANWLDNL